MSKVTPSTEAPTPFVRKVKKQVTATTLKLEFDVPVCVEFLSEPELAKQAHSRNGAESKMAPPTVARVLNLETGEICTLVMGAVLLAELQDNYDALTGLRFEITKSTIEGKSYHAYTINELE